MKPFFYIFSFFISCLALASCEDVIEFDEDESNSLLVTHVMATPDSILYAQVTKSVFFLDITEDPLKDKNGNYLGVKDAEVKLYVNGLFKENMALISADSGIYKAGYLPQEKDEIRIVVSSPSIKESAEGSTILPQKVAITVDTTVSYKEEMQFSYYNGQSSYDTIRWKLTHFTIHFTDNVNEENFYGVAVLEDDVQIDWTTMEMGTDSIDNPLEVFTEDKIIFDGNKQDAKILIFEDDKINGQAYSMSVYVKEITFSATDSLLLNLDPTPKKKRLKFYSFNKDAFLFLSSAKKNTASSGMSFFSEPNQVYTNIKHGIGIIGGFSVAVKEY